MRGSYRGRSTDRKSNGKYYYTNPEPSFPTGRGFSVDANWMAPSLLVTKPSPLRGGSEKEYTARPRLASVTSPYRECRFLHAKSASAVGVLIWVRLTGFYSFSGCYIKVMFRLRTIFRDNTVFLAAISGISRSHFSNRYH